MNEFRKKLTYQQIVLTAALLLACISLLMSRNYVKETLASEFQQGFVAGFQTGIVMSLLGILIIFIIRNIMAIRTPERLKKLYISETDERKLFIRQKSSSAGMNVIAYGLAVGTAVAGNINDTVFFTLLGTCLFVVSVRGFLKLYYRNKF